MTHADYTAKMCYNSLEKISIHYHLMRWENKGVEVELCVELRSCARDERALCTRFFERRSEVTEFSHFPRKRRTDDKWKKLWEIELLAFVELTMYSVSSRASN